MSGSWLPAVIMALAAFVGAIIGAVVRPYFEDIFEKRQKRSQYRRVALEKQLNDLYRPLYEYAEV